MSNNTVYILVRPLGGSDDVSTWERVPWDGVSDMSWYVTRLYPLATPCGSPWMMKTYCPVNGIKGVAVTEDLGGIVRRLAAKAREKVS